MKKTFTPALARAINQQAHILAAQSFAGIRLTLQEKARMMLRKGRSLEETMHAIRVACDNHGAPEP